MQKIWFNIKSISFRYDEFDLLGTYTYFTFVSFLYNKLIVKKIVLYVVL